MYEKVPMKPTITLANAGVSTILNTTAIHTVGPSDTHSTMIGSQRGCFLGWRLIIPFFDVGDQAVTLSLKVLAAGAWVACPADLQPGYADGATLAASTRHQGINWLLHSEVAIFITNGATGPDSLDIGAEDGRCYLTSNPNPGV